jgi:hypothetical protein
MSRKHYIALAALVADLPPVVSRIVVADRLADYLSLDNPAFDRDLFLGAIEKDEPA